MPILKDGCVDTGALSNPDIALEVPAGAFDCRGFSTVRIWFGGTTTADQLVNYQVVLWQREAGCWIPFVPAKGVVTLGANTYGAAASELGATGNLIADTITNTVATSPKDILHSPTTDLNAYIEVEVEGFSWLTVDTDLDSAASVDVFVKGIKGQVSSF